jgi:hypothetical protein
VLLCREISCGDLEAIADLLARGFPDDRRFRDYPSRVNFWQSLLSWLGTFPTPAGLPKYGYCLEADNRIAGVVLLLFSMVEADLRCNVSSWYVEPEFRAYAAILASRATRNKSATFFNLTPAPHTWAILEAQGFVKYALGRFIAIPALCRSPRGARAWTFADDTQESHDLSPSEINVLRDHARWGCISLVCEYDGKRLPFVFKIGRSWHMPSVGRLIYCRNTESFVRFAGVIGRHLLRRGCAAVIMDAEERLRGVPGFYVRHSRRYWKGPKPMRTGDLAYSEIMMLD